MPGKAKPKSTKSAPKATKKTAAKPAAKKTVAKKPSAKAPAPRAVKKPAPKASKPVKSAVASKSPKSVKPAKSAPRNSKQETKAKAKAVVKKKPVSASSNGSTASVRRTRGKETHTRETQVKPGTNFRTPGRPLAPVEQWDAPPEIPRNTFTKKQRARLLDLKDSLVDSMSGMAEETLRARAEGSEASAFGMHQADAGSDAYDRDFALSLLSKEQDALYEIDEALKRIDGGTYGICEMSGKPIPQARLEALPFARFTIECQAEYEREVGPGGGRRPLRSLFGLMGDEDEEEEGEEKETVDKSDD
jgi:RNA polymerase-binding transcription factor DksA